MILAKLNVKDNKVFVLFTFILSIIVGFRSENVGTDTLSYILYYENNYNFMEWGWNLFVLISRHLGISPYFFNFIVATISLSLVAFTIHNEVENRMQALFFFYALGFYFLMFNGMRQMLAVSSVIFALSYLHNGKYKYFLIIVLLTSLIHSSSLYVLPLIFINRFSFSKSRLIILLLTSLLLGFVMSEELFVSLAGRYAHDVTETSSWGGFRESLTLVYIFLIVQNVFLVYIYFSSSKILKNNFWMKIFIVSMILSNLLIRLTLGPRLIYYFSISQIILFTYYKKNSLLAYLLFVYALVNYFRFLLPELNIKEGSLVPYSMTFKLFT